MGDGRVQRAESSGVKCERSSAQAITRKRGRTKRDAGYPPAAMAISADLSQALEEGGAAADSLPRPPARGPVGQSLSPLAGLPTEP
jgi:hypothetical protein